jgi:nitrate reductase NapAB chaperone NapD
MPIVGVLARIEIADRERIWQEIDADPALTPFPVEDEEERIGVLIEAEDLEEAHQILKKKVNRVAGILGTWPVYTDLQQLPPEEPHETEEQAGG